MKLLASKLSAINVLTRSVAIALFAITTQLSADPLNSGTNAARPALSPDGRYVAYLSYAINNDLFNNAGIDVALYDSNTKSTTYIAQNVSELGSVDVSANGRYVVYAKFVEGDSPSRQQTHVYVYDVENQTESRVGKMADGVLPNDYSTAPTISDDGRYIAFSSLATNLDANDTNNIQDIYVYDTTLKTSTLASVSSDGQQANKFSQYPRISGNGQYVTFTTGANNLVNNDDNPGSDIFVHAIETGTTSLASVLSPEVSYVDGNFDSDISDDGRYVTFVTKIWDPINRVAQWQINVRDRTLETTTRINKSYDGSTVLKSSSRTRISGDGSRIVFTSQSSNLVADDDNGIPDLFSYTLASDNLERLQIVSAGGYAHLDTAINKNGDSIGYSSRRYAGANQASDNLYVVSDTAPPPPSGGSCIDSDGDGWGWDGVKSCRLEVVTTNCIDTDGDGWGWDGVKSCRLEVITTNCIDTDGDGWGWDGVMSCIP